MSKKANPTIIGGFVVGATVLVIAGVLIFGSGGFLTNKSAYVLYFDGNVAGLNIGAPVAFRGVTIGSVSRVIINFDTKDHSLRIPVFIELDMDKIKFVGGQTPDIDEHSIVLDMINRGLRAQLKVQSLVTGLLYVEFGFHPEKPAQLIGAEVGGHDIDLPELPTIPTEFEELQRTLKKIPIETMISQVVSSLEAIEQVINSGETSDALLALSKTLKNIEDLSTKVNQMVGNVNHQVEPLVSDVRKTFKTAASAMESTRKTLSSADSALKDASQVRYEVTKALRELSDAARSVRNFAEYLERHPESLFKGKGGY